MKANIKDFYAYKFYLIMNITYFVLDVLLATCSGVFLYLILTKEYTELWYCFIVFAVVFVLLLVPIIKNTMHLIKFKKVLNNEYKIVNCSIERVKVTFPYETVTIKVEDKTVNVYPKLFIRSYSLGILKHHGPNDCRCIVADEKYYLLRK